MAKRGDAPRAQVPVRIPEALRARIEESAARNNRSMNAEMAERLEASFRREEEFGGPEFLNLARLLAAAFKRGGESGARACGRPKWPVSKWIEDPTCYAAATGAVEDVLYAARPRLKFAKGLPTEKQAIAEKVHSGMAKLIARGADIKVSTEGEK